MARTKAVQRIQTDFVEGLEETLIFGKGNSPLQRHLRWRHAKGRLSLTRTKPDLDVRTVPISQAELLRCEVGKHLGRLMKARKISKAALAKQAGVSVRVLEDILEARIQRFSTDQALICLERVFPKLELSIVLPKTI